MAATDQEQGLYPHLLGEAWSSLDIAVRQLHFSGGTVYATGVFRVERGSNRAARLLARLMGLPLAGDAVDIRLQVNQRPGGEEWRRDFANRPLVSLQSLGPHGLMAERVGLVETYFRLQAASGALVYRSVSAALRLGPLRMPLPRLLTPQVTASETAAPDRNAIEIRVEARLPWLGRIIAYGGELKLLEAPVVQSL